MWDDSDGPEILRGRLRLLVAVLIWISTEALEPTRTGPRDLTERTGGLQAGTGTGADQLTCSFLGGPPAVMVPV